MQLMNAYSNTNNSKNINDQRRGSKYGVNLPPLSPGLRRGTTAFGLHNGPIDIKSSLNLSDEAMMELEKIERLDFDIFKV